MSFNTGLSGLRAAQMDLNVTGNNIANASTKGFKQSRAEFGDVYSASILGTGRNSVGSGVLVERVSQQHTQGNIDYTDRALDMAIEGNGYFKLSNNGQFEYTRAGYFDLDKEGYITNNIGKRLQGFSADTQGNIGGVMGDMQISQANVEPKPTSQVDVELNLDSRKPNLDITLFNPNDRTTYSDANQTAIYDSLGIEHVLTQYFIKVDPADAGGDAAEGNTWAMISSVDGKFIDSAGAAMIQPVVAPATEGLPLTSENFNEWVTGGGNPETDLVQKTLAFSTNGSFNGRNDGYDTTNNPATETEVNFDLTVPVEYLAGAWVGATEASGNSYNYNLDGTTQYGASYSAQSQYQDGYTTGRLAGLEVDSDGTIFGRYTNGQNRPVGQVPLITFRNPEGLKPNGSTAWLETSESGIPTTNTAGTGITGTIAGGALEDSNVDLAEELVNMIIGQRNYQANAKTIQAQDTITQTIINLR